LARDLARGEDAGFKIENGTGGSIRDPVNWWERHDWTGRNWSQDDLGRLDQAVAAMHERNGTDTLIQRSNGGYVTLVRAGTCEFGGVAAWNEDGALYFLSVAVDAAGDGFQRTVVHEFGHNWDRESPRWADWRRLSGWTQTDPHSSAFSRTERYDETWWYLNSANFAEDYGHSHPVEDWSTSWEVYFCSRAWMTTNMPAKFALLDDFLTHHVRS
jgi:hypothetical protein